MEIPTGTVPDKKFSIPPPVKPIENPPLVSPEKLSPTKNSSLTEKPNYPLVGKDLNPGRVVSLYKASFIKDVDESLRRCGVNVDYVNPVPLGEGANHLVYAYKEPNQPERVIKLAKKNSLATMTHGPEAEQFNYELGKKYFSEYALQTEVKIDPEDSHLFCVIQAAVAGEPINNKRFKDNPHIQRQLAEIVKQNNKLYLEEGKSLDFVGMPGFASWLKRQIGKLLLRKSEFEVSNILVDSNNTLKIVDFEYFDFRNNLSLKKRVSNTFGFLTNRILMKHYFGLDIKRGRQEV